MSQRIEQHMHLVSYVIKRFYDGGASLAKFHCVEVEDIHQVGMIGLIKADRDFSYDRSASFFTYAIHKIRGEIRRYLRDNNQSVKFPRTIKDVARALQSRDSLTVESIMAETGIDRVDALGVLDYINRKPMSMNHIIRQDSDTGDAITFDDVLPAKQDTAAEAIKNVELGERLNCLSPQTKLICTLVLNGYDQTSVSNKVGISQSRVSRHISKALRTIEKEYSAL